LFSILKEACRQGRCSCWILCRSSWLLPWRSLCARWC